MTEKRLIVDDDYAWIDTTTGYAVEIEDVFDLVNELHEENEQLKKENELLKQDLEHCANQFKDDGKNVLLGLK